MLLKLLSKSRSSSAKSVTDYFQKAHQSSVTFTFNNGAFDPTKNTRYLLLNTPTYKLPQQKENCLFIYDVRKKSFDYENPLKKQTGYSEPQNSCCCCFCCCCPKPKKVSPDFSSLDKTEIVNTSLALVGFTTQDNQTYALGDTCGPIKGVKHLVQLSKEVFTVCFDNLEPQHSLKHLYFVVTPDSKDDKAESKAELPPQKSLNDSLEELGNAFKNQVQPNVNKSQFITLYYQHLVQRTPLSPLSVLSDDNRALLRSSINEFITDVSQGFSHEKVINKSKLGLLSEILEPLSKPKGS